MRFFTLSALLALSKYVSAQGVLVKITTPTAGAATTVTFTDNGGGSPGLTQLVTSQAQIWVGGWDPSTSMLVQDLGVLTYAAAQSLTITLDGTKAGPTANGFYIKTISAVSGGGTVTNYSPRFSIAGMTGVTPTQYVTAAAAAGTAPSPVVVAAQNGGANAGAGGQAPGGNWGVAYNLQTGLTKYAPMQPIPPTKITKQGGGTPLNPTSAFVVATTFLPIASILSTLTQPQTFSVVSVENTAAPQALPSTTGDMAKYLARWKD